MKVHPMFKQSFAVDVFKQADRVKIDPAKLLKEIRKLHKTRPSRKLIVKDSVSTKTLRTAVLTDQSYRSRIVEIKLQCSTLANRLEALRDGVVLKLTLGDSIIEGVTTKTDRRDYIASYVDERMAIIYELYQVVEVADVIIEDIDLSYRALKAALNTFEIATRPELSA